MEGNGYDLLKDARNFVSTIFNSSKFIVYQDSKDIIMPIFTYVIFNT